MATELTPIVFWGQKNDHISLKVDLRDVTDEKINLTEESLEFHAMGKGAQGHNSYAFHIDFYLPVNCEDSKMRVLDRAVEFHVKKQGEEVWPRLTEKQLRLPWLKIDFDKFAFEDDDEDKTEDDLSEKQAQEEVMRQLEADLLKDTSGKGAEFNISYLFLYNLFQFIGYFYIAGSLFYSYIKYGPEVKHRALEIVGTQLMICQGFAVLEVIHPMVGIVKTGVVAPLMQVIGRNFTLFVLILQEPRLQDAPVVFYLFMAWSGIELVRYPFYMLASIQVDVKIVTWLRYTAWIPLYPLGMLFEGTIVIMAIPLFEEIERFSLQLPNSANFAFYFPWFLHFYLLLLAIGGWNLLNHMYAQRKKKFGNKTSSQTKVKAS